MLELENLTLALVIASRKLRPYFHVHTIEVMRNYLMRQVLKKPEALRRLLKWAIELGQFDINYRPRTVIKGQALADFITEFKYSNTTEVAGTSNIAEVANEVEMERDETIAKRLEDGDLNGE